MLSMSDSMKVIVVFRLGTIGDTVIALPCFHALRRAFPSAHIVLLTNIPISAEAAPVLTVLGANTGFIDSVIEYSIHLRNPIECARLVFRLWSLNTDTLIYMRESPDRAIIMRDLIFFRILGFRHLLCVPKIDRSSRRYASGIAKEEEPEASRLARSFSSLGLINLEDPSYWDLLITEGEWKIADQLAASLPNSFIVINTGGKEVSKDWGFERWALFLRRFKHSSGVEGLAIVGGEADYSRASSLAQVWGKGSLNCCGGLTPREVAALLAKAKLFIGHDSGPLHLTQCVRTPALGLFGSFNKPRRWHPLGSHVRVIQELLGMEAITVDKVLQESLSILASARN